MTKLAEAFLHRRLKHTPYDGHVASLLTVPSPELTKHLSIEMLHRVAERIVYLDDIPSLSMELEENRQIDRASMVRTMKLPFDCYWVEYRTVAADMSDPNDGSAWYWGALFEKRGGTTWTYIAAGIPQDDGEIHASLVYVVQFVNWPPVGLWPIDKSECLAFDLEWAFDDFQLATRGKVNTPAAADMTDGLYNCVMDMLFASFLVTQPKVLEEVQVQPSTKLQRSRAAAGKPPLFEYRRLKVRIGGTRKVYSHAQLSGRKLTSIGDLDSERAIQHRRYHKVMGHFRHYLHGDNPHTTWIEPHYRGDPSIGVTFTEREVSK
jgi:hypothetical protein